MIEEEFFHKHFTFFMVLIMVIGIIIFVAITYPNTLKPGKCAKVQEVREEEPSSGWFFNHLVGNW